MLALPVPQYCHHSLLKDNNGKRLAKRDGARSLASLRSAGFSPQAVLRSLQIALQNQGPASLGQDDSGFFILQIGLLN